MALWTYREHYNIYAHQRVTVTTDKSIASLFNLSVDTKDVVRTLKDLHTPKRDYKNEKWSFSVSINFWEGYSLRGSV